MPGLNITRFDYTDVEQHSQVIDEMLRGERTGVIVRRVFEPEFMAEVATRLQDTSLHRYDCEQWKGQTFGRPLIVWENDLAPYFRDGIAFTASCAALFQGGPDYQRRIEDLLSRLGGGRPVEVPRGPDSSPYLASSIRQVDDGEILVHCENETIDFPGMRHLSTLIDRTTQLSYYLTLSVADRGGELMVYGLRFGEGAGRELDRMERLSTATVHFLERFGCEVMDAGVGDLLIFDAGRHFHRVARPEGPRARRTMGGFLAASRDRSKIFYWS